MRTNGRLHADDLVSAATAIAAGALTFFVGARCAAARVLNVVEKNKVTLPKSA